MSNECGSVANIDDTIRICDESPVPGMESYATIMDYDDYIDATVTKSEDVISAIALSTGKEAKLIQTPPNFAKERYTGEPTDPGDTKYTHEIDVLIPNTAAGKKVAKNLCNGFFVVIAEKKSKGANKIDAFDVLGVNSGIQGVPTYDSEAMDGYIQLTLKSTGPKESAPPATFYDGTGYATTKAAVDALLVPA